MNQENGAEIIVEALIERGVPYLFGLCGHGIVGLMDAAFDRANRIEMVSVHNEQVAGFMADAYYRVTGQPVATFTSCGPGSVNIQMAVATALHDSSAMLAITGNVPTDQFNRMPFQELGQHFQADFVTAMRPYVKRSFQAPRADMLPAIMDQAQDVMVAGRPGPVHLDVPFNVFTETVDVERADGAAPAATFRPQADSEAVERALELLASAERPLILAGYGCQVAGAGEAVRALAEKLNIPVATTPQGKGAFDENHPLMLGPTGRDGVYAGNRAARGCDVLLALGTRFGDRSTSAWEPGITHDFSAQKLIHVEIDPDRIGRNYRPDIAMAADVGAALAQLLKAAGEKGIGPLQKAEAWLKRAQGWRGDWRAAIAETAGCDDEPIHPDRAMAEINRAVPDGALVLSDIGSHHSWMVQQFEVTKGRRLFQSGGFATMGFGVCGALGAQIAAPDKPVVAVVGDGGFLMHASAVATAVEYDLPIVWVVWNNGGYVSIRDIQKGYFGAERTCATMFRSQRSGAPVSSDFAMLGKSMGAEGYRVTRPADLSEAISAALAARRPAVIDVRMEANAVRRTAGGWNLSPLKGAPPNYDPDPHLA
ncbi:thiamine pyrophosphate-binding protein [Afifella sp. IM 167]|uniref:thiamine pyrophosphate-binding protein n=1 Tax=Afifella sp. IM 167 TaxID=2033586 RepID=UPI001CD02B12|nr:thiamine pyrophosphate-binding protein [Afifella sp. IM 167]